MPEVVINLENHAEELAVFGSRDQYLRQVRDAFGVRVLARNGVVRVEGDEHGVEQARRAFQSLQELFRKQGVISSVDVSESIETTIRGHSSLKAPGDRLEIRSGPKVVRPRSEGQARYLQTLQDFALVFCAGPAGTGKTYLAVSMAVAALKQGLIKKIVLVRPAVEAGERLGFLPGDLEAKINPYLRPLLDALHDLMDYDQIRRQIHHDAIEIAPLAYMRGRTLNDAMIILDEGQNATIPQMNMFLTRMGQNERNVETGDTTQVDLPPTVPSGLADAIVRLRDVPGVGVVTLDVCDIVRHPLVQAIVNAYEDSEPRGSARFDSSESVVRDDASGSRSAAAAAAELSDEADLIEGSLGRSAVEGADGSAADEVDVREKSEW
jgi:phosphate starvation-inducible PhoH-like protein